MDFILGIFTGILLTLLLGAAGLFYLSREPRTDILQNDPPPNGAPDASVMLAQDFIAAEISKSLRQADKRLIGARLELQPRNRAELDVGIRVDVLNFQVTVQPHVALRFMLTRGRVRVRILDMNIGRVRLPIMLVRGIVEQLLRRAESELNEPLALIESTAHIRAVDLQTDETLLILNFKRISPEPILLPPKLEPAPIPSDGEIDNVPMSET